MTDPPADAERTTLRLHAPAAWPAAETRLHVVTPPDAPRLPAVAGFEIRRTLGRGGMGVVYLATETALNRQVALKVVAGGLFADPELLARFQREAEAIARLQHPNIVQIFRVGATDGGHGGHVPYIALEYANAGSLAAHVGEPLPPRTAARLVATLADAVQYAHDRGVAHRDLKPGNIMLHSPDPAKVGGQHLDAHVPKVTDFGLAKLLDDGDAPGGSPSVAGTVMGTPEYMAPEQADRTQTTGRAADIYALGVVLYELLTGRVPFQGVDSLATLTMARLYDPAPPSRLNPRLPRDLDTICGRCLQKDPGRRYASAAALAADLLAWLAGRPIAARPVGVVERTWLLACRQPVVASLVIAVVALAAGGFAGVFSQWQRAESQLVATGHALDAAERHLYYGRVGIAQHELAVGNHADAVAALDACRPTAGVADRRGWEWYYLRNACRGEHLVIPAADDWVWEVAYSPDGKLLATAAGTPHKEAAPTTPGELTLWDAQTGRRVRRLVGHRGTVRRVAFSPDGRHLCSAGYDHEVRVWAVATGAAVGEPLPGVTLFRADRLPNSDVGGFWFTPDGRALVFAGPSGWQRYDLAAGTAAPAAGLAGDAVATTAAGRHVALRRDEAGHALAVHADGDAAPLTRRFPEPVDRAALSADGRLLAVSFNERAELYDLPTGRRVRHLNGMAGWVETLAISPDGRRVAAAGSDRTVYVWEDDHKFLTAYRGHAAHVLSLAFAPDGKSLASCDRAGEVRVWDLARRPRQQLIEAGPSCDAVHAVALSADGTEAVVVDRFQDLKRFDMAGNLLAAVRLAGPTTQVRYPRTDTQFGPGGERLYSPLDAALGTVGEWDARTGEAGRTFAGHALPVVSVAVSGDGRRLAAASGKRGDAAAGEVIVWDIATGDRRLTLPAVACWCIALSADGTRLAGVTRAGEAVVWDVATGRELWRALAAGAPDRPVFALAFSPDGALLAVGDFAAGGVRVFDAATGRPTLPVLATKPSLTGVTFTPDGRRVVAAGYDSEVRMWDVATGQLAITLPPPTGPRPSDLAFTARPAFSRANGRLAMLDWRGFVACWDGAAGDGP